jgi:hypothetical protein
VTVDPGGEAGWDEPPLDIQVPDDARELDRDVLAYHREQRARRRRRWLRRLAGPFAGQRTVLPLLASILAVCLVAGAMLSVATFNPGTSTTHHRPAASAPASPRPSPQRSGPTGSASASGPASSSTARPSGTGTAASSAASSAARRSPRPAQSGSSGAPTPTPPGGP